MLWDVLVYGLVFLSSHAELRLWSGGDKDGIKKYGEGANKWVGEEEKIVQRQRCSERGVLGDKPSSTLGSVMSKIYVLL